MLLVLIRSLILLTSTLLSLEGQAAPVVAFSNLPPPGNFKVGGSDLDATQWKALLFTTPTNSKSEIVSVEVGLSCWDCSIGSEPYPSVADLQITLYSVTDQGGTPTPDTQIYSIPMQSGLILTGRGTLFTFSIPNWRLEENTSYALVLKSTLTGHVKWGNIEVGGVNTSATAQNGFSFNAATGFVINANFTPPLLTTTTTNNSVKMDVVLVPPPANPIPTLSEWTQIMMMLAMIATAGVYGWRIKQR